MPSIIPGYVYSLFAALLVGAIVVCSCSVSAANLRDAADRQQLTNINEYVAAESLSLLSRTTHNSQNSSQFLNIPSLVGNQRFWISISNDSSSAMVESGFGTSGVPSDLQAVIPAQVVASGIFVSGSGRAILQCHFEGQITTLTLASG